MRARSRALWYLGGGDSSLKNSFTSKIIAKMSSHPAYRSLIQIASLTVDDKQVVLIGVLITPLVRPLCFHTTEKVWLGGPCAIDSCYT